MVNVPSEAIAAGSNFSLRKPVNAAIENVNSCGSPLPTRQTARSRGFLPETKARHDRTISAGRAGTGRTSNWSTQCLAMDQVPHSSGSPHPALSAATPSPSRAKPSSSAPSTAHSRFETCRIDRLLIRNELGNHAHRIRDRIESERRAVEFVEHTAQARLRVRPGRAADDPQGVPGR